MSVSSSAARVLLLRGRDQNAYRGFFRLLSEQHMPFAVSDNLEWMDGSVRGASIWSLLRPAPRRSSIATCGKAAAC